jgi:hypothetical protein
MFQKIGSRTEEIGVTPGFHDKVRRKNERLFNFRPTRVTPVPQLLTGGGKTVPKY